MRREKRKRRRGSLIWLILSQMGRQRQSKMMMTRNEVVVPAPKAQ
jgi:hypothetical protein